MVEVSNWRKLDNAAKIFPPTSNSKETWVFRVACQLTEQVEEDMLQTALDKTVNLFPLFTSVVKKGLFWYYLEETNLSPKVKKEQAPPCRQLYYAGQRNLLFEVSYNGRRINFEVYHALTDGAGAMQFVRTLVYYYLLEAHKDSIEKDISLEQYNATAGEKEQDGYSKYYVQRKGDSLPKQGRAYQLKGNCFPSCQMGVIEGRLSVEQVKGLAKKHGATVSELLTTFFILAIGDEMAVRDTTKPVVVVVPVNLRNYFPCATARNFFSVANISYSFAAHGDAFEDVLAEVKTKYKELISEDKMRSRLNALYAAEDNIIARLVPRTIKNLGLKAAEWWTGKENTVSFTSRMKSTSVQSGFFRRLAALGMDVEVSSNTVACTG